MSREEYASLDFAERAALAHTHRQHQREDSIPVASLSALVANRTRGKSEKSYTVEDFAMFPEPVPEEDKVKRLKNLIKNAFSRGCKRNR